MVECMQLVNTNIIYIQKLWNSIWLFSLTQNIMTSYILFSDFVIHDNGNDINIFSTYIQRYVYYRTQTSSPTTSQLTTKPRYRSGTLYKHTIRNFDKRSWLLITSPGRDQSQGEQHIRTPIGTATQVHKVISCVFVSMVRRKETPLYPVKVISYSTGSGSIIVPRHPSPSPLWWLS